MFTDGPCHLEKGKLTLAPSVSEDRVSSFQKDSQQSELELSEKRT